VAFAQMKSLRSSGSRGNALAFPSFCLGLLGRRLTADGFCRGELVARLDPTMDKVVGLVRNQVEAVAQECKRLPKVCPKAEVLPLWNDEAADHRVPPSSMLLFVVASAETST
jgi:hypothetical protein